MNELSQAVLNKKCEEYLRQRNAQLRREIICQLQRARDAYAQRLEAETRLRQLQTQTLHIEAQTKQLLREYSDYKFRYLQLVKQGAPAHTFRYGPAEASL